MPAAERVVTRPKYVQVVGDRKHGGIASAEMLFREKLGIASGAFNRIKPRALPVSRNDGTSIDGLPAGTLSVAASANETRPLRASDQPFDLESPVGRLSV